MISRRQFLRHAIATGVVAAVAPPLLGKRANPFMVMESTAKGLNDYKKSQIAADVERAAQLTYKDLEETYNALVLEHDEPDLIWVSDVEHYRRIVRIISKINEHPERYHWETVTDGDLYV